MKGVFLVAIFSFMFFSCFSGCKRSNNEIRQESAKVNDTIVNVAKTDNIDGVESFRTFYTRFLKDEAFQLSRIEFPVDGEIQEEDKDISGKIEKKDWITLVGSIYDVDQKEYTVEIKEDSTDVYHRIYIPDSSVDIEMKYKLIDNKWYMIYYRSIFF